MKKLGLYLHIPFCARKCRYCAFLSFDRYGKDLEGRYLNALFSEIERQGALYRDCEADTVFFGGGTPSIVPPARLAELLDAVRRSFRVSEEAEITMESNPGTVTAEALALYRRAGFNRLSMGVQSLNDGVLSALGRVHTAETARRTYRMARNAGFANINFDLMFSLPRLTETIWEETLSEAIALSPEHISFYSLQLEEGTEFYQLYKDGKLAIADDETDRRMYHKAAERLAEAGYLHYEISNAAKPAFACRHNLKYWSFDDYLGLGLGASSFTRGRRFQNPSDFETYFALYESRNGAAEAAAPLPFELAQPEPEADAVFEYVFTGLRKTDGIDLADFCARFGRPFSAYYPHLAGFLDETEAKGLLRRTRRADGTDGSLALTLRGFDVSNGILSEFAEPCVRTFYR